MREHDIVGLESRFSALETKVTNLEDGIHTLSSDFTRRIGDISASLSGLSSKLDERSRTPWSVIISAMGVVLAIVVAGGQLARAPIDSAIARLERDTQTLAERSASKGDLDDFRAVYQNNRIILRQDFDTKIARLDADIRAIEASLVPRGEHEERWRSFEKEIADLQRQIEDVKKLYGDAYSLKDVVRDLQSRLDRVERLRLKPLEGGQS